MNRHLSTSIAAWTILIAGLIGWEFLQERSHIEEQARIEARAIWDHNLSYRKWVTAMGGVYVRRDKMEPNPYLLIPERDKKTVDGISLTMANPAYMTGQVFDIIRKESQLPVINRIVSEKYLNPRNKPDEWETKGLQAFAKGTKEVSEITLMNRQPYLRLFKPMITTEGCLKCHGQQGYKVGDIRGGISVAIPMKYYYGIEAQSRRTVLLVLLPIWGVGVIATTLYFRKTKESRGLLQESEARLSLALDAGNQAWWEWNFKTGKTIYSARYYRMLGYEPDEFPARYEEWKKRVHPADIVRAEEFIRKHLVENKTDYHNLEMRMLTKDGQWRWISDSGKIVERDAEGNPVRLVGTNLDIDDQKQADIAQQLSEEMYQALFDGVPDALVIADIDTGIVCDANRSAERLFGRSRVELLGMHQSRLHPARLAPRTKESFRKHSQEAGSGNISGPFEHIIVRADGSEVPVEVVTQPVVIFGKTMIQGVFRDITERKRIAETLHKSEALLRAQFESSPDTIMILDRDYRFVQINKTNFSSFEVEDLIGQDSIQYLPEEVRELARAKVEQCFAAGEIQEFDHPFGGRWVHARIVPMAAGDKIDQVVVTSTDITERKQADDALHKLNEELELRVRERTAELEAKNAELQRANKLFVGRELRMAELKERIKELEGPGKKSSSS